MLERVRYPTCRSRLRGAQRRCNGGRGITARGNTREAEDSHCSNVEYSADRTHSIPRLEKSWRCASQTLASAPQSPYYLSHGTESASPRCTILVPLVHSGGLGSRRRVTQPKPPQSRRLSCFSSRRHTNIADFGAASENEVSLCLKVISMSSPDLRCRSGEFLPSNNRASRMPYPLSGRRQPRPLLIQGRLVISSRHALFDGDCHDRSEPRFTGC